MRIYDTGIGMEEHCMIPGVKGILSSIVMHLRASALLLVGFQSR